MKKILIALFSVACFGLAHAQVGIGTVTPEATLHVNGTPANTSVADGIIPPKLSGNELKAKDAVYSSNEIGAIVYVTTAVGTASAKTINVTSSGYFYFDGSVWQKLVNGGAQENIYSTNGTIGTGRAVGVTDAVNFDGGTFVIDATNNRVGIGTAAPTNSLEISGSSNGSNFFPGFLVRNSSATGGTSHSARIILGSGAARGAYIEGIHTGVITNDHDLAFATSSGAAPTEKMRILANGNVGIGTSTTNHKLSVNGDIFVAGNIDLSPNTNFRMTSTAASQDCSIDLVNQNTYSSKFVLWSDKTGVSNMFTADGANGNVGVNSPSPDARLEVVGNGTLLSGVVCVQTTSGTTGSSNQLISFKSSTGSNIGEINVNAIGGVTYSTTSDIRLKENIKETVYGINDLMKISVADYYYKADKNHEALQTGFLAQQLHSIYPNAVSVGGEDETKNPWGVDYGKLTPLLVKAIQDQQEQIEILKKEIDVLKSVKEK